MQNRNYTIKTMTREEVGIAIEWAVQEGWNPGWHDAACYFTADPNGFLMGFLGGEPIATISVVKYGESFGFLGLVVHGQSGISWQRLWPSDLECRHEVS